MTDTETVKGIKCDSLVLGQGESIDKLNKVYWSRKRDQLLAQLSIRKVHFSRNLGQRQKRATANELRIVPLLGLRKHKAFKDPLVFVDYMSDLLMKEVDVYKKLSAKKGGKFSKTLKPGTVP